MAQPSLSGYTQNRDRSGEKETPVRLDSSQIDFYRTHGYLPLPGLFAPRYVKTLMGRLEEVRAAWERDPGRRASARREPGAAQESGSVSPTSSRTLFDLAREDALFYAHVRDRDLLDAVQQLLGAPLCLYADEALLKPPLDLSEEPERQDNARLQVEPADGVLSCWTALDDADLESGCLCFYPGSHRGGLLPPAALVALDRSASTAVPMQAGGCILYHSLAVYWAPPNPSERWRRGFTCRFVRSDAFMGARHPNSPPLLEMRQ